MIVNKMIVIMKLAKLSPCGAQSKYTSNECLSECSLPVMGEHGGSASGDVQRQGHLRAALAQEMWIHTRTTTLHLTA